MPTTSGSDPQVDLLRDVLELAVAEARRGDEPVPQALRPFVNFTRLNDRALAAARRAVDADDGFRRRLADKVSESSTTRAPWLWLHRPDGWTSEFDELCAAASVDVDGDPHGDRLAAAEQRASAAEAERDRALERERAQRSAADRSDGLHRSALARVAELEERLSDALAEVERLTAERRRAVADLKRVEELHQRSIESQRLSDAEWAERLSDAVAPPPPEAVAAWRDGRLELTELAGEVNSLAERLALAAAKIPTSLADVTARPRSRVGDPADTAAGSSPEPARTAPSGRASAGRRRAVRLPPPMVDGTAEAIRWLLGRPGVVVLVDGYNLSMTIWPDQPIAVQRSSLLTQLDQLAARSDAQVAVVFDGPGSSAGQGRVPGLAERRFSGEGVEADDYLIEWVGDLPATTPVVVVSSDRRVRDGVATLGANPVTSSAFADVLRA